MKKQDEMTRRLIETVGKRIAAGESPEVNRWAQEIVRQAAAPPEKQQPPPDKVRQVETLLRDHFAMPTFERAQLVERVANARGARDTATRFLAAVNDIKDDPFFAILAYYYGEGLSNRQCADRLFYDERTLRRHRKRLVQRLARALE